MSNSRSLPVLNSLPAIMVCGTDSVIDMVARTAPTQGMVLEEILKPLLQIFLMKQALEPDVSFFGAAVEA